MKRNRFEELESHVEQIDTLLAGDDLSPSEVASLLRERRMTLNAIESIEIAHLIDFKSYFAVELDDLREMEKGGLLTIDDQWISVLPRGRLLVRGIAMAFDKYLRTDRERVRYSKVI